MPNVLALTARLSSPAAVCSSTCSASMVYLIACAGTFHVHVGAQQFLGLLAVHGDVVAQRRVGGGVSGHVLHSIFGSGDEVVGFGFDGWVTYLLGEHGDRVE